MFSFDCALEGFIEFFIGHEHDIGVMEVNVVIDKGIQVNVGDKADIE